MIKNSIHTLVWNNSVDSAVIDAHQKVTKYFNLNINYHYINMSHGMWIDNILKESTDDFIGFLDIDCIPVNKNIIPITQKYVFNNQTFLGIAQASSHLNFEHKYHIFAAPAFFFIYRKKWNDLGCPSFVESDNCDVAQFVTRKAENLGLYYQCLYPTHYDIQRWKLGNYGFFGIGTHYTGGVYHLYESRCNNNIDLFIKRCSEVVSGTFSTDNMKTSFNLQ